MVKMKLKEANEIINSPNGPYVMCCNQSSYVGVGDLLSFELVNT